jgi:hypothetical protein
MFTYRLGKYVKNAFLSSLSYAVIISAIFLVLGIVLVFHHEMWRDEVNVWLIAKDIQSPFGILQHLRYDGHPGLWHLCVFAIRHIIPYPIAMQILHLLIATDFLLVLGFKKHYLRLDIFLFMNILS